MMKAGLLAVQKRCGRSAIKQQRYPTLLMPFNLKLPWKLAGGQPQAVKELLEGFTSGDNPQTLLGITGSGKTVCVANVVQALGKKTLVLAHNKTLAAQLYAELTALFPDNRVEYFVSYYDYYQPESYLPTTDTYIEKDSAKNEVIDALRLRATASLLSRDDVIVVASVSCIYGLGDPTDWERLALRINSGDQRSRQDIIRSLVEMQYERNDVSPHRGQFRVKGDTIDIVPGYQDEHVRLELFGDSIERISVRHHITKEEVERPQSVVLFPAKHFVTPEDKQERAIASIKEELEEVLPTLGPLEEERLRRRTKFDLEMIEQLGYCNGIENYSRHFSGRKPGEPPHTLLDFFGEDWLLVIDESHQTLPQVHAMANGDKSRKQPLIEYGFRLPSAFDNRPLTFAEFEKKMPTTLFVSATPGDYELSRSKQRVDLIIRPTGLLDPHITVKPTKGQIDDLLSEIHSTVERGNRVLVTTLTKKMAEDLTNYLARHEVKVRYLHSEIDTLERSELIRQLRAGDIDVIVGINLLREGLDIPEVELVAVLDADKEGFLRNERSLLQTAGRAARNERGRVVMYAERTTDSMQRAINITRQRRVAQEAYNQEHGIKPKTIIKSVPQQRVAIKDTKHIPDAEVEKTIEALRIEMADAAEQLNFELAIDIRDRIKELEKRLEKNS
jgi:excinuclease ABC subunit B